MLATAAGRSLQTLLQAVAIITGGWMPGTDDWRACLSAQSRCGTRGVAQAQAQQRSCV